MELFAQIIGIAAMALAILSFQCKLQRTHILMQILSCALFALSFGMRGLVTGMILNLIATVRAVVYLYKQKLHTDRPVWLIGFVITYFVTYALSFTVFGTEPTLLNFIIELLPVIGMTASNLGLYKKDAKAVRLFGLISSPSWLIYNIVSLSIGAIICETFSIFSILIGIARHDLKKKDA